MLEFGGAEHLEELVTVYRAHNEPLHEGLELFAGMDDVLIRLKDEGRKLGLVSAKRRSTVELAFAATAIGHLFDVVVGGDEAPSGRSPRRTRCCSRSSGSARPRIAPCTSATRRSTWAPRKAGGLYAVGVTWGGVHDRDALAEADEIVDTPERARLPSSDPAARAAELRERLGRWSLRVPRPRRADRRRRRVRPRLRRARGDRDARIPS